MISVSPLEQQPSLWVDRHDPLLFHLVRPLRPPRYGPDVVCQSDPGCEPDLGVQLRSNAVRHYLYRRHRGGGSALLR